MDETEKEIDDIDKRIRELETKYAELVKSGKYGSKELRKVRLKIDDTKKELQKRKEALVKKKESTKKTNVKKNNSPQKNVAKKKIAVELKKAEVQAEKWRQSLVDIDADLEKAASDLVSLKEAVSK